MWGYALPTPRDDHALRSLPTPTRRHDDSRYDASQDSEVSIWSLFHSKSLNCNLSFFIFFLTRTSISPLFHWQDHISRLTSTSSWAGDFSKPLCPFPCIWYRLFFHWPSAFINKVLSHLQGEIISHVLQPLALEPEISLSLFAYFPGFPTRSTNSRCSLSCHVTLSKTPGSTTNDKNKRATSHVHTQRKLKSFPGAFLP